MKLRSRRQRSSDRHIPNEHLQQVYAEGRNPETTDRERMRDGDRQRERATDIHVKNDREGGRGRESERD